VEWQTKAQRLDEMEDIYGPLHERLGQLEPGEAERLIRDFEAGLDKRGQDTTQPKPDTDATDGDSWLNNILNPPQTNQPSGLTEADLDKRMRDFETRLKAESTLDDTMDAIGVPDALRQDFGMRVLNRAKRIDEINGVAEELWKQDHEAHLSIEERKRQEIEQQKDELGGNATRMGQSATTAGGDPRSKMDRNSKEFRAYVAERLMARARG
jgi:hypothetical protein